MLGKALASWRRDGAIRLSELTHAPIWDVRRPARETARTGPTRLQYALAAAATAGLGLAIWRIPYATAGLLSVSFLSIFTVACVWKLALAAAALARSRPEPPSLTDEELPRYAVIVPLYREAQMVPGLLQALGGLDYPRDRLQVILALEPDDAQTRDAVQSTPAPAGLSVEVALSPAAGPRTKPKACNAALARATGALITVYDAEDRPHPGQLREAAARMAAGPARLGCLQAPLRIAPQRGWLPRQFALEYAALFDVALPGYAALGLPFPLGGTSNHFRREALDAVGGWDPGNVTEDADIGFRLAARGWRLDVMSRPTLETAPSTLAVWTPQRTRWVKGHMQTWGVHARAPLDGGWRRLAALQLSLGLSLLSSLFHGALATGVAACVLVGVSSARLPVIAPANLALLFGGWGSAVLCMQLGARRAGLHMRIRDALAAPLYWPLQSLAAVFAVWQLVRQPFYWDKTPHEPQADLPAR